MMSWFVTYPQDVIKSRIQADGFGPNAKYRGYSHCLKVSVAKEGYGMLFRGMNSTLIRAFPVNAVTMGVVTFVLQAFSDEKISPYNAMSRLRLSDSMHFELPAQVENYFDQRTMKYHHNVVTRATDGPSIVQIERLKSFAVAPYRMYVENVLYSTPTKFKPRDPQGMII